MSRVEVRRDELRAVISAVQRLAVSVHRLERLLEEPGESVVEEFRGWERIEGDYQSGEGLDQLDLRNSLRCSWETDGPPPTPDYLVEKAIVVCGWSEAEARRRVHEVDFGQASHWIATLLTLLFLLKTFPLPIGWCSSPLISLGPGELSRSRTW